MQVTRLQQAGVEVFFDVEVAGRRAAAEVLHHRIAAIGGAGLELEAGGVPGIDGEAAAVQALGLETGAHEAAKGVIAHPRQPGDLEAQATQADGHVVIGAGDALAELVDRGQLTRRLGDELVMVSPKARMSMSAMPALLPGLPIQGA